MKTNFRVFALGTSLMSLALCVGCAEDQSNANGSFLAYAGQGVSLAAEADTPSAPARPADAPVPVVKNDAPPAPVEPAPPPGSIIITKATATNIAAGTNVVTTNVVQAPPPAEPPKLSPALAEVVRLLQANVAQEVLLAYITNSTQPFYVGASEIVYLRDLGAPSAIVTALINLDASPEMAARKQAAISVKPLPVGVALNQPVPSVVPAKSTPPPVPNPPDPVPVNPPANQGTTYLAPPPADTTVTYDYQQPTTEVNYNYFYSSLSPYGSWLDVPGYGSCWRPTVATWNSSWRPYYNDGRWLWCDSGWYWYSDYSWGWAPFHYGRWCQPSGYGWVWVPDTVWGSSWVSWRYSSSYCGWAPLPPTARYVTGLGFYYNSGSVGIGFEFGLGVSDYCYIPATRFCDPYPYRHCVPHHQNHGIHKDTTVVNNYIVGNNNTIINNGVGLEKITKVAKGDVKHVALKDTTSVKSLGTRHDRLEADGKTLTVYRPPSAVLARKSVVSSPVQNVSTKVRPSTYVNSHVKPAATVSGSSVTPSTPAPASTAPASATKPYSTTHNTPVIMNSRSGPTPVTLYTKPANAASQPVIVTGGSTPAVAYTKPDNSDAAAPYTRSPRADTSRATKPAAGSTYTSSGSHHDTVAVTPDRATKPSAGYTKPLAGSASGHNSTVSAGKDPLTTPYKPGAGSGSVVSSAPKSGYTRTEPGRNYTQPAATTRPPVVHSPSQSYSKPAPSAPSQTYSRPAPPPSYSAPSHSGSHNSRVSAPSGGGQSGGSYTKPSGASSSSSSSSNGKNSR